MKDFRDKNVYIAGGSSGIGLATAKLLSGRGADITIFSRDEHKLARAAEEILEQRASAEQSVAWMQLDVSDRSAVESVLNTSIMRHGIPDILINCAGRAYPHYFEDISFDQFDETMKINLYGMWHITKKLVPLMKERGGYIVNVSSIAGFVGVFDTPHKCTGQVLPFVERLRAPRNPLER